MIETFDGSLEFKDQKKEVEFKIKVSEAKEYSARALSGGNRHKITKEKNGVNSITQQVDGEVQIITLEVWSL